MGFEMEHFITSFGGVLLRTSAGNYAVNGGAAAGDLRLLYLRSGEKLNALVLTSEHRNRSRGAASFAVEENVPLYAPLPVCHMLPGFSIALHRPVMFLPPTAVEVAGAKLEFRRLRGDSIDPVFLILEADGCRVGVVPDGKLDRATAAPLFACRKVLVGNRFNPEKSGRPGALERRLRSVCNTDAELDELFAGYDGELVRF